MLLYQIKSKNNDLMRKDANRKEILPKFFQFFQFEKQNKTKKKPCSPIKETNARIKLRGTFFYVVTY